MKGECKFHNCIHLGILTHQTPWLSRSATAALRGDSYNAALASILNGSINSTCNEITDACYYLNAIAGARAGNETMLFANLEKALQNSELYKIEAINDLEFVNYREHEKFISLTK